MVSFQAPVMEGQKPGGFMITGSLDRLRHYVKGKRVLDVFSYVGGWGIQAAAFADSDLRRCVCPGIGKCSCNAELNEVQHKVDSLQVMPLKH